VCLKEATPSTRRHDRHIDVYADAVGRRSTAGSITTGTARSGASGAGVVAPLVDQEATRAASAVSMPPASRAAAAEPRPCAVGRVGGDERDSWGTPWQPALTPRGTSGEARDTRMNSNIVRCLLRGGLLCLASSSTTAAPTTPSFPAGHTPPAVPLHELPRPLGQPRDTPFASTSNMSPSRRTTEASDLTSHGSIAASMGAGRTSAPAPDAATYRAHLNTF